MEVKIENAKTRRRNRKRQQKEKVDPNNPNPAPSYPQIVRMFKQANELKNAKMSISRPPREKSVGSRSGPPAPRSIGYTPAQIAHAIVDPENGPMLRTGGVNGSDKTACGKPKDYSAISWVGDTTTTQATAAIILRRSNLCNTIRSYSLATTENVRYSTSYTMPLSSASETVFDAPLFYDPTAGSVPAYGTALYPCRLGPSDKFRGYWVDAADGAWAGTGLNVLADAGALPVAGVRAAWYKLVGNEWQAVISATLTSAAPSFDYAPGSAGYYSLTVANLDSNPAQRFVNVRGRIVNTGVPNRNIRLWAHRTTPFLDGNVSNWDDCAVLSGSVMLTNTQALIQKGGEVTGGELGREVYWYDNMSFDTLADYDGFKTQNAEHGAYTFIVPDSYESLLPRHEWVRLGPTTVINKVSGGPLADAAWDLYTSDACAVLFARLPLQVAPSGYWKVRLQIEMYTPDTTREHEAACATPENWALALSTIKAIPRLYTNDFHISDIWKWVKNAAKDVAGAVVEYGPTVAKAISTMAPYAAMLL